MLAGLDERIAHETEIDVHLVESALECVVLGAGRCIEEPAALRVVFQAGRQGQKPPQKPNDWVRGRGRQ